MGGYASDLFRIFFRMEPRKMVEAGFDATSHGESEFQSIFGVLETIETIPDADNACSRAGKSTARLVRRPGASPLLFGKFLMSSTVFVTLEDIAEYLPPYEESVLEVDMDEPLQEAYKKIEKDIRRAITENKRNRSLISLALHRLLLYPDHPFGVGEIWGKKFDPEKKRLVPSWSRKHRSCPRSSSMRKNRSSLTTSATTSSRDGDVRSMRPSPGTMTCHCDWNTSCETRVFGWRFYAQP